MASPTYLTRDGDVLDAICWRRYGSEQAVLDVVAANPGITAQPEHLPAGLLIALPDLPNALRPPVTVRLWGRSE